jgi:integrase
VRDSVGRGAITGKRLQSWKHFLDIEAALRSLTSEHSALHAGARQRCVGGGPTLTAFLRDYYREDRRGLKGQPFSPRMCEIDLVLVERSVIKRAPAIADPPVGNLGTEPLANLFRLLAAGDNTPQPLARATLARLYRTLSARMAYAVKLGLVRANPTRAYLVMVDGKPPRDHKTLNADQARAAIVRRALVRTKGNPELRETRTRRTRRQLIPASMVAMLKAHRKTQTAEKLAAGAFFDDTGLVFATRYGKAEHLDNPVRRHFKPLLLRTAHHVAGTVPPALPAPSRSPKYAEGVKAREEADVKVIEATGFPLISLYQLRHTQATLPLCRGVHPEIVADRLGHARTSTTLDIYSHVTPDMQDKALTELEAAIGDRRAESGGLVITAHSRHSSRSGPRCWPIHAA